MHIIYLVSIVLNLSVELIVLKIYRCITLKHFSASTSDQDPGIRRRKQGHLTKSETYANAQKALVFSLETETFFQTDFTVKSPCQNVVRFSPIANIFVTGGADGRLRVFQVGRVIIYRHTDKTSNMENEISKLPLFFKMLRSVCKLKVKFQIFCTAFVVIVVYLPFPCAKLYCIVLNFYMHKTLRSGSIS